MYFITFTQSNGYIMQCSPTPASAPANMCVLIVVEGGKLSYNSSSSFILYRNPRKVDLNHTKTQVVLFWNSCHKM